MRYKAVSLTFPAVRFDIALFDVTGLQCGAEPGGIKAVCDVCCSPPARAGQARAGWAAGPGCLTGCEAPPPPVLARNLPVKILSVVDKKVRQESQPQRDSQAVRPASEQHQTLSRSELRYQRGERGGTSDQRNPPASKPPSQDSAVEEL